MVDRLQKKINRRLLECVSNGNLLHVKICLREKADINCIDWDGWSPLMLASYCGNTKIVEYLIAQGANLDIQNEIGETALHNAVFMGRLKIVKILLKNNARIDIKNKSGDIAIHSVLAFGSMNDYEGSKNILNAFLEHKVFEKVIIQNNKKYSVNITEYLSNYWDAVHEGNISKIKDLLETTFVHIDERNEIGNTALMNAVLGENYELAKWLLENGANPDLTNDFDSSPLLEAVSQDSIKLIKILLLYKADKNLTTRFCPTVVDYALKSHKQSEIIKLLTT